MAIVRVKRKKGVVYRVRWRDESGRMKSKSFDRKKDAEAYEAKVVLAKRRGDLDDLDAGRQLFREFAEEWWTLDAEPRLATRTLRPYGGWRDRYVLPGLGDHELRQLTPAVMQRFQTELLRDGVSELTVRKTLVLTQGILERAVEWGRIPANPVRPIRKPAERRARAVRPLAPETVESLRQHLLTKGRFRDATLISVLAYAGLRPGEALALRWGDVQENTLLIDKALVLGETKSTKTGRTRTVRLLKPLATDLAEWKVISSRPMAPFGARMAPSWRPWRRRFGTLSLFGANQGAERVTLGLGRYGLRGAVGSASRWALAPTRP